MPQRTLPSRELLEQIRTIERGGSDFATGADVVHLPTGWAPVDQRLTTQPIDDVMPNAPAGEPPTGGLQRGAIHEWFGVADGAADSHTGARSGDHVNERIGKRSHRRISCRVSRRFWTPPLCLMIHLAWQALLAGANGNSDAYRHRRVAWVGRKCWPYGRSLIRPNLGKDGRRLLEQSLFIDTDSANPNSTRRGEGVTWVVDLALRNPAVTAVIADGSGLDMAATRRLQLAAESGITNQQHGQGGAIALLARPPDERHVLSAAATRWWVQPQANPPAYSSIPEGLELGDGQGQAQGSGSQRSSNHQPLQHLRQHPLQRWNAAALTNAIAQVGESPRPRWRLTLLRCKGAGLSAGSRRHKNTEAQQHEGPGISRAKTLPEGQWILEWSDAKSSVVIPANLVDRPGHPTYQKEAV